MLEITIPGTEEWDEDKEEFITTKETTLRLEHSLVSLSKWESRWGKPFLDSEDKTIEETLDSHIDHIRINDEKLADAIHREILEGCHISCNVDTQLTPDEEINKYDYLKSIGFHCLDTLWYTCRSLLESTLQGDANNPVALTEKQLQFAARKITWPNRQPTKTAS